MLRVDAATQAVTPSCVVALEQLADTVRACV
jgi:hypothetical protein